MRQAAFFYILPTLAQSLYISFKSFVVVFRRFRKFLLFTYLANTKTTKNT